MADSGTYDGEPEIMTCSEVLALAPGVVRGVALNSHDNPQNS
jgi:hypothetical protein